VLTQRSADGKAEGERERERNGETRVPARSRERGRGGSRAAKGAGKDFGWRAAETLRVALTPNSKHALATCTEYRLVIFPRRNTRRGISPPLVSPSCLPLERDRLTLDDILFAKSPACKSLCFFLSCVHRNGVPAQRDAARYGASRFHAHRARFFSLSLSLFCIPFVSSSSFSLLFIYHTSHSNFSSFLSPARFSLRELKAPKLITRLSNLA